MDEVLDDQVLQDAGARYSPLMFVISLINFGLFFYLYLILVNARNANEGLSEFPMIIVLGLPTLLIIGIILTLICLIRREAWSWYKWTGVILHFLMFLVVMISLLR